VYKRQSLGSRWLMVESSIPTKYFFIVGFMDLQMIKPLSFKFEITIN
jgi:hypothetical protein